MSIQSFNYLLGQSIYGHDIWGDGIKRYYLSDIGLRVITAIGALLALAGTFSLVASQGYFSTLLPLDALKIAGTVGISIGAIVALVHGWMLICKEAYGRTINRKGPPLIICCFNVLEPGAYR